MPITVPLEALRVANATVDILQRASGRFPLAFAHAFSGDEAARQVVFSTSDAVIVGQDLLGVLQAMATDFTVLPIAEASPALRRALSDPVLRAVSERALVAACQSTLTHPAKLMIINAWHGLLLAFFEGFNEA